MYDKDTDTTSYEGYAAERGTVHVLHHARRLLPDVGVLARLEESGLMVKKGEPMEERRYVGGVAEHQRGEQEKRFEELGLEDFFWSFIRLQSRVDDLEAELAELKR
jgi:hypothetical protein